jgi:flavodoxin
MGRTLVVYYSRDGHTRSIAREIALACGADIEEITERTDRSGPLGYLRSALEALFGIAPAIRPSRFRPQPDDLVIVGTPIWFWNLSSPVRSYLQAQRSSLGRVAYFCTFGGSGSEKVLRDMQTACGHAPLVTLALTQAQCATDAHRTELAKFIRGLKRGHGAARIPASPRQSHSPSR